MPGGPSVGVLGPPSKDAKIKDSRWVTYLAHDGDVTSILWTIKEATC